MRRLAVEHIVFGSVAGGDVVLAADKHFTIACFFDDLGLAFCHHHRVSDQGHQVVAVEVAAALELGHEVGETVPERCRLRDAEVEVAQLPGQRGGQGFAAVETASDLAEGNPDAAKRDDLGEAGNVGLRVAAMTRRIARRPQEPDLVVMVKCSHRHAGLMRQLTDRPLPRHARNRKRSRRVRCKRILRVHSHASCTSPARYCRTRVIARTDDILGTVPASVPGWFASEQLAHRPGISAAVFASGRRERPRATVERTDAGRP